MSQLLEGFENWSGGLPVGWTKHGNVSMAQSTSHVTQGTYSAHVSNGSRYLSMGHRELAPALPAGKISVDVYVVSGAVRFSANSGTYSVLSSGLGEQTLVLDVPVPIYNIGFVGTSLPGPDEFYADNIRIETDAVVVISVPAEFKLTKNTASILLDTILPVNTTSDFELQFGNINVVTDVVVKMTDTLQFKLDFAAGIADWLATDWEYPDWATASTSPGFKVFVDAVTRLNTPKKFNLTFSPITVIGDGVVTVPNTKEYKLTLASGIIAYTATIVRPETLRFILTPQEIEAYSEVYKEYLVMESSPFDYEILGVNVGTVDGGGRMTVFVDNQIIASDLVFDPTKTNIPLSGIINRGQRLWVGIYMKNGYFRSFDSVFALKRTQT